MTPVRPGSGAASSGAFPVPVTVVGGFLGAGKTSLLNHLLVGNHGRRIAVLVNDFGAVNIDARLIVAVEGETVSLANGCVCCTIREDLIAAVLDLVGRDPVPEHIVVETSGVSKPVAVAESFRSDVVGGFVELHGMINVVDAELALDVQSEYRDLATDQIEVADLVVLNKTDLVSPGRLDEVRERVRAVAGRARIWETSFGHVPDHLIFGQARTAPLPPSPPATTRPHAHEAAFATWTYRSSRRWSLFELQRAVEKLPTDIYRAKGIVGLDLATGDYGVFQLTGRRSWVKLCGPDPGEKEVTTELVFIGKPGCATDSSIEALFSEAVREQAACERRGEGYVVSDLRGFEVVFA